MQDTLLNTKYCNYNFGDNFVLRSITNFKLILFFLWRIYLFVSLFIYLLVAYLTILPVAQTIQFFFMLLHVITSSLHLLGK
jgi:hypothetical protein